MLGLLFVSATGHAGDWMLLEQGWTNEQRERFWSLGQGAEIVPYRWFLVLEQAGRQRPFNSAEHIRRLGYIPWPENPAGLPVGFTRAANPHTGREWLGMNCAACHTNTIAFEGRTLLVDGAPTLADYWAFNLAITAALEETLADEGKFRRFADALGAGDSPEQRNELRNDLATVTAERLAYNERNRHRSEYGHGRLDAIGFIFNEVTVGLLRDGDGQAIPDNRRSPEAPVSYPFLWGTSQADYVQWNGVSFAQLPLGNLARDVVEVLGVYGKVDLDCEGGFRSSLLFRNSIELADMVQTLKAPQWPNDVFPPVDLKLASEGEALYRDHCVECHEVIPRDDWNRRYRSGLWPTNIIGTDALYTRNAVQWVDSGCLAGESIMPGGAEKLEAHDMSYSIVSHVALKVMGEEPGEAIFPVLGLKGVMENLQLNGLELRKPEDYYKARPLNGIWATAPYLHNGSVPTLYDLLLPPDERPRQFRVGCREFDPTRVGFRQDCDEATLFEVNPEGAPACNYEVLDPGERAADGRWLRYPYRDPRFPDTDAGFYPQVRDNGNCNIGHDVRHVDGSAFDHGERSALVEYLKTL
ncbi:MAG: di-heme-cytochrome C peroxidase [Halieaceae bacterium]|nr:di-heme-cytochrome C peroxidase [Halieaceae bacterium]